MRKLLFLLLFLPGTAFSQGYHKLIPSPGEYTCTVLDTVTHKAYDATLGKLNLISGQPAHVEGVFSGSHHACMTDSAGNAYCYLDNSAGQLGIGSTAGQGTPTRVTRDSLGNAMLPIAGMSLGATPYGGFWQTMAWSTIATGGVLYIWGNTQGGAEGNGTWGCATSTYPVRISFPTGVVIKKAIASNTNGALDTAGNPWTWGFGGYPYSVGQGNNPTYMTPTKIVISAEAGHKCVDIEFSGQFNYLLYDDGNLYATGSQYYTDYIGIYPSGTMQTTFQKINSYLNLPKPIWKLGVHNESTFAILTDSTLWAWGGNVQGTIGIGIEINFALYGCCPTPYGTNSPAPYDWDQGPHELQQLTPIQVAKGKHNFTDIHTTSALCYGAYFSDVHNVLYVCGRDKDLLCYGQLPGNQTNGLMQATFPNGWDVTYLKEIPYMIGITTTWQSPAPYCIAHPSATGCSTYTIPSHTPPTAVFTGSVYNTNQIVLSNNASSDAQFIQKHIMTQTGGPVTLDMGVQDAPADTIVTTGGAIIPSGTYTFRLKLVNNNWDSTFATVSVTVGAAPPTVSAGGPYTITLPISGTTLSGTATGNGGATITSVVWTQTSGPATASFGSATTTTTTVSGLTVQGTYSFTLHATDNNGNTNSASANVVVSTPTPGGSSNALYFRKGNRRKWISN